MALEYERKIMAETVAEDCLFIAARGLSMERLFFYHLKMYSHAKLLCLVLNTSSQDESYFAQLLKDDGVELLPKFINAQVATGDRRATYLEGGVQFVTSRVLIVDLLTERVPVERVAAVFVWRAHQLLDSFQESFIVRLYRQRRRDGLVKAFSDAPTAVARGLGQLQRLVSRLLVRRVLLLPRFHDDVKRTLDDRPAPLTELTVGLDGGMRQIQSSLTDVVRLCLADLKSCTPQADEDGEKEEEEEDKKEALYDSQLERRLRPVAAQLSERAQSLLGDLAQVRQLLSESEQMDHVTFFRSIVDLRKSREAFASNSGWLFTTASARIVAQSKRLVGCSDDARPPVAGAVALPPKWTVLRSVVEEVRSASTAGNVLLLAASEQCCRQLAELVRNGAARVRRELDRLLAEALGRAVDDTTDAPPAEAWWPPEHVALFAAAPTAAQKTPPQSVVMALKQKQRQELVERRRQARKGKGASGGRQLTLDHFAESPGSASSSQESAASTSQPSEPARQLVVRPLGERYSFLRLLSTLRPSFVILYHVDLFTMRQLETYKASYPDRPFQIFLLMYSGSTEEERYLMSLQKEQGAFERLIRESKVLNIPKHFDGSREMPRPVAVSTRRAGGQRATEEPCRAKVVVDMRELASELPLVLYERGVDVLPLTLEVGDYVLAPDVCVERKSHDDLTQSLLSGRVLQQADQMLRHYATSLLLVEGNGGRARRRRQGGGGPFDGDTGRRSRDVRALLTQLARRSPRLAVVWAADAHATADLFDDLKAGKAEPDEQTARSLRSDELGQGDSRSQQANPTARKMLLQVAGATEASVRATMASAPTLLGLFSSLDAPRALLSLVTKDFRASTLQK